MASADNSFEAQMIFFYGYKKIMATLLDWCEDKNDDKLTISDMAKLSIMCDIAQKYSGINKTELASAKNKMQIEMYEQLERDRQYGK